MAFTKDSTNGYLVASEAKTLPASATTEYSSEIDFLKYRHAGNNNQYCTFVITLSGVSGTNVDFALYGAYASGGTKFLLKDALIADQTAAGTVAGTIDIKAYPAPYYYVAWTADADESANTVTVRVLSV